MIDPPTSAAPRETVLVTGAAGYIGSHTCVQLLEAGHRVIAVDNLENSHREAITAVSELAGPLEFHEIDIRETDALDAVMQQSRPTSVIHFAGKKSVAESVRDPLLYFESNIAVSIALLRSMAKNGINRLVFSSSCTVYGNPTADAMPVSERAELTTVNPYGRSKLIIEQILNDHCTARPDFECLALRYFNPVGAHPSGTLGEDSRSEPTNLMPLLMDAATGVRPDVTINGNAFPTPDGTCVRDYLHVMDVAAGHLQALDELATGFDAVNLGTGNGTSVIEMMRMVETVTGKTINHHVGPAREGDAALVYSDPTYALERLGWKAHLDLEQMCQDHWRWQAAHPNGYGTAPIER